MVMRRNAEADLKEQLRARFVELYGEARSDLMRIRSTKTRNRVASEPVISGLAAYVRAQCATPKSRDAYLARMGLYRKASGSLDVHPL